VIVNDVSGGTADPEMLATVAAARGGFVLMHMRGTPATMQEHANYDDVVGEVSVELRARIDTALAAGVDPRALVADPGLGFAKTAEHNLALLHALPELAVALGVPIMVGASRKSFLGRVLGDAPADAREWATLATSVWCFEQGATMVRVHAAAPSRRVRQLLDVMDRATSGMAA
jgi:dihydropteroate synthase